jgi:hypothetical protein
MVALGLCLLALVLVLCHDLWIETHPALPPFPGEAELRLGSGEIFRHSEQAPGPDRFTTALVLDELGQRDIGDRLIKREPWLTGAVEVRAPGVTVAAFATKARVIELEARAFQDYLLHDGLRRVHEKRVREGRQDEPAIEQYRKCARSILCTEGSPFHDRPAGLELEIRVEPSGAMQPGAIVPIRVLFQGAPLSPFTVGFGHEDGTAGAVETDAEGRAVIRFDRPGRWYLRGIHMIEPRGLAHAYESCWASTTLFVPGGRP